MPSIDWNRSMWGEVHSWPCQGSEWSVAWGGVEAQWFTTILEIAPGYGRWSDYLVHLSETYTGVDLAETCVKACKERFSTARNATFALNDGKSLPMISDASVDFVFSFDSLVHAEADVIESYLTELSRVFSPDGIGFIHHSNLGTLLPAPIAARMIEKMARKVQFARRKLQRLGVVDWVSIGLRSGPRIGIQKGPHLPTF
jgi:ubiquinone/menaquinone biosynthesis C-methylase UbiE